MGGKRRQGCRKNFIGHRKGLICHKSGKVAHSTHLGIFHGCAD